jgi:ribose-phosphate pyrophosphokinase
MKIGRKILDLTNIEKSEIKWKIDRFPDGQINFRFIDFDRKGDIDVIVRIKSSDDLFILSQLKDILNRSEIKIIELKILYLLGARQDRVLDIDQPYTLKLVADVVNSLTAGKVYVYDPHSMKTLELIKNSFAIEPFGFYELDEELGLNLHHDNIVFVFPDNGAIKRETLLFAGPMSFHGINYIVCGKTRDKDNNLNDFTITEEKYVKLFETDGNKRHFIVKDDLCDGGGTFCGLAPLLREQKPHSLSLYVTHAIQKEGIEKVAKLYDNVLITNSYYDWETIDLPKNVKVLSII